MLAPLTAVDHIRASLKGVIKVYSQSDCVYSTLTCQFRPVFRSTAGSDAGAHISPLSYVWPQRKASELWVFPVQLNYVTCLCNNWMWVYTAWGNEGGTSVLLIVFEKRFRRSSCKPHVADAWILPYIIYIETRQPFWPKDLTAVKALCL